MPVPGDAAGREEGLHDALGRSITGDRHRRQAIGIARAALKRP